MPESISRRALFRRAGVAGLVLAVPASGYAGYRYPWSGDDGASDDGSGGSGGDGLAVTDSREHRFVTRPDLRPPRVTVTFGHAAAPAGYVFLAPKGYSADGPGQEGCLIIDGAGEPVWFEPRDGDEVRMDFRPQTYRGRPVLTWWHGEVTAGHGAGSGTVYDSAYRKIGEVRAGNGQDADLHEFLITERGTALITAYVQRHYDLTPVGGPRDGWLFEGVVQELDIASGAMVMEWRSLDDVPLEQTLQPLEDDGTDDSPFDYIHLNSIQVDTDDDLIVSARNTSTVYKVARDGSGVRWRMGGRPDAASDFAVAEGARFSWQHTAAVHPDGTLTVFDNSSEEESPASQGLALDVDYDARTVALRTAFVHPSRLRCDNQGSTQVLDDGGALIGWGAQPYISRFDADGGLLWDARLPHQEQTYRAYTADWQGAPDGAPAAAARPQDAGGAAVYASWNGATDVRSWRVLAGDVPDDLAPVVDVPRAGFETLAVADTDARWFVMAALDDAGREIGRSDAVELDSDSRGGGDAD